MKVSALKTTHIIKKNEDILDILEETLVSNKKSLKEGSVLVIAETLVATCQGRIIDLNLIQEESISKEAKQLSNKYSIDPRLGEMIIKEADNIIGGIKGVILSEKEGVLIANSGIDKSNSGGPNEYSLWPVNPFETSKKLWLELKRKYKLENLGIIISDSRVHPMRRGVIGVAIGVAGFEPLIDCRGMKDLYGEEMRITLRATADQLADTAHVVMGEADEQTPFVLIEEAPVKFTNKDIEKKSMLMPKNEDLFFQILNQYYKKK